MGITSSFQNLLNNLNHKKVWDVLPHTLNVASIQFSGTATLTIEDDILRLETGNPLYDHEFDLTAYTVYSLLVAIDAHAGYSITYLDSTYNAFSATKLQAQKTTFTNSVTIGAFVNYNYDILKSCSKVLATISSDMNEMTKQTVITSSSGHWLTYWGFKFGIVRMAGETDAYYRNRIVKEVFRLKCNAKALEKTLADILQVAESSITITNASDDALSMYDGGLYSGTMFGGTDDKVMFCDATSLKYFIVTIDILGDIIYSLSAIIYVLDKHKAAGTRYRLTYTQTVTAGSYDDLGDTIIDETIDYVDGGSAFDVEWAEMFPTGISEMWPVGTDSTAAYFPDEIVDIIYS